MRLRPCLAWLPRKILNRCRGFSLRTHIPSIPATQGGITQELLVRPRTQLCWDPKPDFHWTVLSKSLSFSWFIWYGELNLHSYWFLNIAVLFVLDGCIFSLTFITKDVGELRDTPDTCFSAPTVWKQPNFSLNNQNWSPRPVEQPLPSTIHLLVWETKVTERQSHLPFSGNVVAPGGGTSPLGTQAYKSKLQGQESTISSAWY